MNTTNQCLGLPCLFSDIKTALASQHSVSGIPKLVILSGDGSLVDGDGRTTVAAANGDVDKAIASWTK